MPGGSVSELWGLCGEGSESVVPDEGCVTALLKSSDGTGGEREEEARRKCVSGYYDAHSSLR